MAFACAAGQAALIKRDDLLAHWYVLQTKARHESVAERNLENQAFSTFLPWLQTQKRVRGRWQSSREPLFPGYLFVELDIVSQNTAPIRSTRGVIRLVRLGNTLRPFPEKILNALRQSQATGCDAIDPARLFKAGDNVKLVDGPMAGLNAIFKARNSQERVVVLLNMLGVETEVSVSPHQLTRAI